jgi:hypothetical protein
LFNKSQNTLIHYPSGRPGSYAIPTGVTQIADFAFSYSVGLTNILISETVTNLGRGGFRECPNLTDIVVAPANPMFSSHAGVLFNLTQDRLIEFPQGRSGDYIVPAGVTRIGGDAFTFTPRLINVTLPSSVTNVSIHAFTGSTGLEGLYFSGNTPSLAGAPLGLLGVESTTVYYLPRATGWSLTFGGCPTALWQPYVRINDDSFGVQTNGFGFNIDWANGMTVVIEASTNPTAPVWLPLQTNTLTADSLFFTDPDWTNHPARFYRVRRPGIGAPISDPA